MGNENSSADNQAGYTGDVPLPPDPGTHQESSSPKTLQAESEKSSRHGQTIKKKKQRKKSTEKSVNQDTSLTSLTFPTDEVPSLVAQKDNQDIPLPIQEISSGISSRDNQDISTLSLGLPIKEISFAITPEDNQDIPSLNLRVPIKEISSDITPESNQDRLRLPAKEIFTPVTSEVSQKPPSLNLGPSIKEISVVPDDNQDIPRLNIWFPTNEISFPAIPEDNSGPHHNLSPGLPIKALSASVTSGVSQDPLSLNLRLPINEFSSEVSQGTTTPNLRHAINEIFSGDNQYTPSLSPAKDFYSPAILSDSQHTLSLSLGLSINDKCAPVEPRDKQDTLCLNSGHSINEISTILTSGVSQDTSSLSPGLPIREITSVISDNNHDTTSLKSELPIKEITSPVTPEDKQESPNLNFGVPISEITASVTSRVSHSTPNLTLRDPINEFSSSEENLNIPFSEIFHSVKPEHEQDLSILKTVVPLDEKRSSEVTGTSCEDVKERDQGHSDSSTAWDPALLFASPGSSESEKGETVDTSGIRTEGNSDGAETSLWKPQATSSVAGHMPQDEGQLTVPVRLASFLEPAEGTKTKQRAPVPAEDKTKQCANLSSNASAETAQLQELVLPMPVSDICRGTKLGKQNNAVGADLENHSVGAFLNRSDNGRAEDGRVISCCPAKAGVTQESQQTRFREAGLLQGREQLGVKCQSAVCLFPPGKIEDYISIQESKQDSGGRKSAVVTEVAAESTDGPGGLKMDQVTAETLTGQSEVAGDSSLPGTEAMTIEVHELAISADKSRQMESCAELTDLPLSPAMDPEGPDRCQDENASSLQQMTQEKHGSALERDASRLPVSSSPDAVILSLEEEKTYAALSVITKNQTITCCPTKESLSLLPSEEDHAAKGLSPLTLKYASKLPEVNCGELYVRKFEEKDGAPLTEGAPHLPEDKTLHRGGALSGADRPSLREEDGSLCLSLSWHVEADKSFCEHHGIDDEVSETPSEAQSKSEKPEMLKSAEEMTRKGSEGVKELMNTALAITGGNVQEVIGSLEIKQPYFPDTKVCDDEAVACAKDVEQIKAEGIYGHNEEQAKMCETRGKEQIETNELELSLISMPVKHNDKKPDQNERAVEEDLKTQSYLSFLEPLAKVSASDHPQLLGMIQKPDSKPLAEEKQSIFSGNVVPEIPDSRASSKSPAQGEETSSFLGCAETIWSSSPNVSSQHKHVLEEHKRTDMDELFLLRYLSGQSDREPPKDIIVSLPVVSVSHHEEIQAHPEHADTSLELSQVSLAMQNTSGGGGEPTACVSDTQHSPTTNSAQAVLPNNRKPAISMHEVPENLRYNANKLDHLRDITKSEGNLQPEELQELEHSRTIHYASTAKNEEVMSVPEKNNSLVATKSETVVRVPEKSDPPVASKNETMAIVSEKKSDPSVTAKSKAIAELPEKSKTMARVPERSDPSVKEKSETLARVPEKSDPSVSEKSETMAMVLEKSDPSIISKNETMAIFPEKSDPSVASKNETMVIVPEKSETMVRVPEKSDPSVASKNETMAIVSEKSDPSVTAKSEAMAEVPEKSDPSVASKNETMAIVPEKSDPSVTEKSETMARVPEKSDPSVSEKSETMAMVLEKSDPSIISKNETMAIFLEKSDPSVTKKSETMARVPEKSDPSVASKNETMAIVSEKSDPSVTAKSEAMVEVPEKNDPSVASKNETMAIVPENSDPSVTEKSKTMARVPEKNDPSFTEKSETMARVPEKSDPFVTEKSKIMARVPEKSDPSVTEKSETMARVPEKSDPSIISKNETMAIFPEKRDLFVTEKSETMVRVPEKSDPFVTEKSETMVRVPEKSDLSVASESETVARVPEKSNPFVTEKSETMASDPFIISKNETMAIFPEKSDLFVIEKSETMVRVPEKSNPSVSEKNETMPRVLEKSDPFVTAKKKQVIEAIPEVLEDSEGIPAYTLHEVPCNQRTITEAQTGVPTTSNIFVESMSSVNMRNQTQCHENITNSGTVEGTINRSPQHVLEVTVANSPAQTGSEPALLEAIFPELMSDEHCNTAVIWQCVNVENVSGRVPFHVLHFEKGSEDVIGAVQFPSITSIETQGQTEADIKTQASILPAEIQHGLYKSDAEQVKLLSDVKLETISSQENLTQHSDEVKITEISRHLEQVKDIQFSEEENTARANSGQWGEERLEKEFDPQRSEICTANTSQPQSQQYQNNISEIASPGACNRNVSQLSIEDIGAHHTDNDLTSQKAMAKVAGLIKDTQHKCIISSTATETAVETNSQALSSAPRVPMLERSTPQEATSREPMPGDSEGSLRDTDTDTDLKGTDPSCLSETSVHGPQSGSKINATECGEKDDAELMSPEIGELSSPTEDSCLNVGYDVDLGCPLGGVSSHVATLLTTSLEAEAICNANLGSQKETSQENIVSDKKADQEIIQATEQTSKEATSQASCRSKHREEEDIQSWYPESFSNHHSLGRSGQDLFSGKAFAKTPENNLQVGDAQANQPETDNVTNRLIHDTFNAKSAAETQVMHPTAVEGDLFCRAEAALPSEAAVEANPEASDGIFVDTSMEMNCTEAVISPKGFHLQTSPVPEKTTDFGSLSISYDHTNAPSDHLYNENLPYFVQTQPPFPTCAGPHNFPVSGTDDVTTREPLPLHAGPHSLPFFSTHDVTTQKPVPSLPGLHILPVSAAHDVIKKGATVESVAELGPFEEPNITCVILSPELYRDVEPLASDSREVKKGQRRSSDSEEAFETPESTTPVKSPPTPPPPLPDLSEEIPRSQLPSEDTGLGSISDTISATDVSQAESVDENPFRPPSRSFSAVFDEDKPIASSGTYNLDFEGPVDPFLSSPLDPDSPVAFDSKVKARRKSSDSLPVSRSTLSRSLSLQASDFENSSCLGSSEASITSVDIPSTGIESAPSTLKRTKKARPPSLKKKQTTKKSEETKEPPVETSNIGLQVEESATADTVPEAETKPTCTDVLEIPESNSKLSVEPSPSLSSHSPHPPVSETDSIRHTSPLTTRRNVSPPPAAEVLEVIPPDTEGPDNISVKGQAIRLEFDYSEDKEDVQEKSHTSKKLGKKPTAKMPQRKPKTKKVAERLDSDPTMSAKLPIDSIDMPISTGSYTLDIDKWDDPNFNPFSSGGKMQASPRLANSEHKTETEDSNEVFKPSPKESSSLSKASASFEIPSSTSETHEHEGEMPTKSAKKKKTPLKTDTFRVKKSPKRSSVSDAPTQEEPTSLPTPESPPVIPMVEHATDEEKLASSVSNQKWVAMDIGTDQQDYPEPSDLSTFVQENKLHSLTDELEYGNTFEVEYMEKIGSSTPPRDDSPKKLPLYLMFDSENGSPEKSPAVPFSDSVTPGSGSSVEGPEVQLYPALRTLSTSQGTNGQRPKQNLLESMSQSSATGNLEELLSPEDSCVSADALLNRISHQASICDAHGNLAPDLAEKNPSIFAQKLQREVRAAVAEMPLSHMALYPQTVALETNSAGFLAYQQQGLEQTLQVAQEEISAKEREALEWKEKYEESRREVVEMRRIVAEYEKTIAQMIEDEHRDKSATHHTVQQLIMEKEQALSDLNSVEKSLADLFRRYEKMKEVLEGFRKNEDVLKKCAQEYLARVKKEEQRYHALKVHAEEKLDRANAEIAQVRTKSQQEQVAYQASLRKEQLKVAALERTLEQKNKETEELTKICDELIAKMGRS
uniref:Transforming acidic coiled-coil-containing protein 2 isoform X3 n=1 Tax=Geotrypetes seraphini TaxID=260995 RepID=A0A6P8RBS9_GEOSA|nr:transforming acidic coiled-coil-containing protein 2 isoform X3 [Geotrypetes seraphini]